MSGLWEIRQGDALERLREMADETVQCCVTSPPYFGLRDYGEAGQLGLEATPDEYVAALVAVMGEVRRVLRADGTLWLNLGDTYAMRAQGASQTNGSHDGVVGRAARPSPRRRMSGDLKNKDLIGIPWMVAFALRADGWYLRSDVIWAKPNPMPESVTDRPTRSHEYLFLLTKSARYFYDHEAIKEGATFSGPNGAQHSPYGQGFTRRSKQAEYADQPGSVSRRGTGFNERWDETEADRPLTRNKRSVWTVATKPYAAAHFATFPPKLIEPCVLAGSAPDDLVLDPFAGAGTTGLVALRHDRCFVGIELNPAYCELARRRIRDDSPLINGAAEAEEAA